MLLESFKSVDGTKPGFSFHDSYLTIDYWSHAQNYNYDFFEKIEIKELPFFNNKGVIKVTALTGKEELLYFDESDSERIKKTVEEANKKIKNKDYVIYGKVDDEGNTEKKTGEDLVSSFLDKYATIIGVIIMILVAVLVLKGCVWFFSDSGDSDNDGLTDSFEQEIGTDPDNYTWNWEWND